MFKTTSPEFVKKSAAQVQRAMKEINRDDIQSRFERNKFLIDPKHLHLLVDHDKLDKYQSFAIFKPSFCPMRRLHAVENYHRVSVESFLQAALKSREISPISHRIIGDLSEAIVAESTTEHLDRALAPSGVQGDLKGNISSSVSSTQVSSDVANRVSLAHVGVRVHNDLHDDISGPVFVTLVPQLLPAQKDDGASSPLHSEGRLEKEWQHAVLDSVSRKRPLPESLHHGVTHYEAMIFGHEVDRGVEQDVDPALLFPNVPPAVLLRAVEDKTRPLRCTTRVEKIGYYSVHAVSLVRISIFAPPVAASPDISRYVRQCRGTFVVGDPEGNEAILQKSTHGNPLRGDFDFPRVFVHLRTVAIDVDQRDVAGAVIGSPKAVDYHCKNCFEPLIQRDRSVMFKRVRIQLVDGSWSPRMM